MSHNMMNLRSLCLLLGLILSCVSAHAGALQQERPNSAVGWQCAIEAERHAGNLKAAFSNANEAVQQYPTAAVLYAERAYVAMDQGKTDQAKNDLQAALNLQPNCAEAYAGWGIYHIGLGNTVEAGAAFNKAVTLAPENPMMLAAQAYYYDAGIADFQTGLQKLDRAWKMANPAQRASIEIWRYWIDVYALDSQFTEENYSRMLQAADQVMQQTDLSTDLRYELYKWKIKEQMHHNDYTVASQDNMALLKLKLSGEQRSMVFNRQGWILDNLGQHAAAEHFFKEAIRLSNPGTIHLTQYHMKLLARKQPVQGKPVPAENQDLPAFYDLRRSVPTSRTAPIKSKSSFVSDVRNQGVTDSCWAHSAATALESNLYWQQYRLDSGGARRMDFHISPWYLDWVTFNRPLDVVADSVPHVHELIGTNQFNKLLFYRGFSSGDALFFPEFMMANGTGLCYEPDNLQPDERNRMVIPHQYRKRDLNLRQGYSTFGRIAGGTQMSRLAKEQILRNGAVAFRINGSELSVNYHQKAFFSPIAGVLDHVVNVVGWDDDYDFSSTGMDILPRGKGAWIVKNSYGTSWGDDGYGYVSYENKNLMLKASLVAEVDTGTYSSIATHERVLYGYDLNYTEVLPPSWFAAGFTAEQGAFLNRIGFYTYEDGVTYRIEVRTGADHPDKGRLVYTQQGTFGQDGTPAWSGYRTIDLAESVFLPKGMPYTVSVRLVNPKGKAILMRAPQEKVPDAAQIRSYIRIGDKGAWKSAFSLAPYSAGTSPGEHKPGPVVQRAYLKNVDEPVGHDFTVASLQGNGQADACIQLGHSGELYGLDRFHPDRQTLSTMTVRLQQDESYDGQICGDGGVIKEGTGRLILAGQEAYTGGTKVRAGSLLLAPGRNGAMAVLSSDVEIGDLAAFGGSGQVKGNVNGHGQLILNAGGTLQIEGSLAAGLHLQLEQSDKLQPGQVLLRVKGGIPDALATLNLAGRQLVRSADRTELIVR